MKNMNLKKALIAAGIAVFSGALFLGVNVAMGIDPNAAPGNGNVSPTFSGVNVQGPMTVGGNAVFYDDINISENSIKFWDADEDLYGQISGNQKGGVNILDFGTLPIGIKNSLLVDKIVSYGMNLDNRVHISDLNIQGSLNSDNGDAVPDKLHIDDVDGVLIDGNLDVNGIDASWMNISTSIWNGPLGPVKINDADGLILLGDLNMTGEIKNSTTGMAVPVTIDDQLELTGNIINPSINSGASPNNPVWIGENLAVNGKVTATNFGTFIRFIGSRYSLNANSYGTKTMTCAGNLQIVDCGVNGYLTAAPSVIKSAVIGLQSVYLNSQFNSNSCTISVYNTSAASSYYYEPYALCLDPAM